MLRCWTIASCCALVLGVADISAPRSAAGAELTCGSVTDSLAVAETHTYELTAATGSAVMVAVGEPSGLAGFDPAFTLTDGNDAVLASCSGGNGCNATATLTGPAPHTVNVFDVGSDAANTYNLSVVPLSGGFPDQASCSASVGCDATTPIADSLARGELHSYVLATAPDTAVMVGVAESLPFGSFDPTVTLTDGDGVLLATCSGVTGCNVRATLTGPSPHTLTVFDAGSDIANDYNLTVVPLSDGFSGETGCTETIGCESQEPTTGSLLLGEIESYRVSAEPGSTLMIGIGESSLKGGFNPSFVLTDGEGTDLAACSSANGCSDTVTLTGPAPYTITVFDEGSDSAHGYSLSVAPLSDAFPDATACTQSLGCDSQIPAGGALARGQIDSYRLEAEPGGVVMIAIAETSPFDGFDPTFSLTDADGAEIATCSATVACNQRATLSGPAPYTVTVFDAGSDIANSYNLTVTPLSDAFPSQSGCTPELTCSTPMPVSASLAKGDLAGYRLDADTGDVVTIELAENPAVALFDPAFSLTDGDGVEIVSCSGTNGCTEEATLDGPPPFTVTVFDLGSNVANGYRLSTTVDACSQPTTTTTPASSTSTTSTTTPDAEGRCSQPVSTGASPTASDCLYVLGAAVGSRTCSPACICDTDSSGQVGASDALRCLRAAVGQSVTLTCPCA